MSNTTTQPDSRRPSTPEPPTIPGGPATPEGQMLPELPLSPDAPSRSYNSLNRLTNRSADASARAPYRPTSTGLNQHPVNRPLQPPTLDTGSNTFHPPAWLFADASVRPWEMPDLVPGILPPFRTETESVQETANVSAEKLSAARNHTLGEPLQLAESSKRSETPQQAQLRRRGEFQRVLVNSVGRLDYMLTELEDTYQRLGVRYHTTTYAARVTLNADDRYTLAEAFGGIPRAHIALFDFQRRALDLYAQVRNDRGDGGDENRARIINMVEQANAERRAFRQNLEVLDQLVQLINDADRRLLQGDTIVHARDMWQRLEPWVLESDPRARAWIMTLPETARQFALGRTLGEIIRWTFNDQGDGHVIDDFGSSDEESSDEDSEDSSASEQLPGGF